MDNVYVWHPRSKPQSHSKMESAEEFDLVFLSEKWTERRECDGAVGEEWLQYCASLMGGLVDTFIILYVKAMR